ncbi:2'-5' RNA ligase, partial [Escherichia coli]
IVSRNHDAFSVADFSHNVFKYVRKNHVKTTVHWKRHWQRARMAHEFVYGEQS